MPTETAPMPAWWAVRRAEEPHDWKLPEAPPWRRFTPPEDAHVDYPIPAAPAEQGYQIDEPELAVVNTALALRRPLLVTGLPGSGKTTLANLIAWELGLGRALKWPINTRSTLTEGLYRYDAISRLQDASLRRGDASSPPPPLSRYLKLGPLGTALLPTPRPRVLLIDEIDKSDVDLPNDLLNVLESGEFEIPELSRAAREEHAEAVDVRPFDSEAEVPTDDGWVRCREFPIVVMTSNAEREFPPAFLRRCLRLDLAEPNPDKLKRIVRARLRVKFEGDADKAAQQILERFIERRKEGMLSTDQLLNAIFLALRDDEVGLGDFESVQETVFRFLTR